MHNAANIDCLSSQSFTAFSLCTLGFSDCYSYFFAFLVCDICPPLPLLDSLSQVMVVQNARQCGADLFFSVDILYSFGDVFQWFSILLLWPLLFVQLYSLFHSVLTTLIPLHSPSISCFQLSKTPKILSLTFFFHKSISV